MRAPAQARAFCYACFRPRDLCVCAHVVAVDNRTHVAIVQHQHERPHPFGTVKLLRLALRNVQVRVAWEHSVADLRPSLPGPVGLLYPGPQARDLATLPADALPKSLVLIDGTWSQAKTLLKRNPWLGQLPQFGLTPARPSVYRIRREPKAHCLSTLEALQQALAIIEPETRALATLHEPLEKLVDAQVARLRQQPRRGRLRKPRMRPSRALPAELSADPSRWVVAYAELAPVAGGRGHEAVYWTLRRPQTREECALFAAPVRSALSQERAAKMGLSVGLIERGLSPAAVRAALANFVRADDLVAAWSPITVELLKGAMGRSVAALTLKGIYCNTRRGPCGHLEELLTREGLTPIANGFVGRAHERMGAALAVLELLRKEAACRTS